MANTDNTKETFGYSSIEIGVNFDWRKITKEAEKLIIVMEAEIQKASKNLKMGLVFDDTNIKKAISEYAKLTDSITKAIEGEKLLGSKGKGGDLGIKLSFPSEKVPAPPYPDNIWQTLQLTHFPPLTFIGHILVSALCPLSISATFIFGFFSLSS